MADEPSVEERLKERFHELPPDFLGAISFVYWEIVDWHEYDIRLNAAHFQAMRENEEMANQCLIYLLARDLASGGKVPLLVGLRLVEEMGGKKGWARLRLRRAIRLK